MAQISNITLPDGTNYNLKGSIYTVIGTQTATTAAWTGTLNTIDALYDGLTIAYYLPRTSAANVTLNLTLKNGTTTGAVNCYYKTSTRLGTHYAAGDMILLTYWKAGSIKINGTATTDNRWIAHGQCSYSFTPAGTITIDTAGATNNTLKPVTAKTVVTGATFNTVVTGGTTTNIPNITVTSTTIKSIDEEGTTPSLTITPTAVATEINKRESTAGGVPSITVLNAASTNANGVSSDNCTLTIGANVEHLLNADTTLSATTVGSASNWNAGSMPTVEEIEVGSASAGTPIAAYTSLTTGASGSATTGDSVTLGSAVTVKTGDASYKFTGTAGTIS